MTANRKEVILFSTPPRDKILEEGVTIPVSTRVRLICPQPGSTTGTFIHFETTHTPSAQYTYMVDGERTEEKRPVKPIDPLAIYRTALFVDLSETHLVQPYHRNDHRYGGSLSTPLGVFWAEAQNIQKALHPRRPSSYSVVRRLISQGQVNESHLQQLTQQNPNPEDLEKIVKGLSENNIVVSGRNILGEMLQRRLRPTRDTLEIIVTQALNSLASKLVVGKLYG